MPGGQDSFSAAPAASQITRWSELDIDAGMVPDCLVPPPASALQHQVQVVAVGVAAHVKLKTAE